MDSALHDGRAFNARARHVLCPLSNAVATDTMPVRGGAVSSAHPVRGDWDLNPGIRDELAERSTRRAAAVLVPVIERDELTILLTRRPEHMNSHAGQISFPGGKLERDDKSVIDAALRETEEEVGIAREFIEPLGLLDGYHTSSGFDITPVVALVNPGFTLSVDANEVAEAFEVPLRFLMDDSKYEKHSWNWRGKTYFFHAITYGDYYIWGATAGILKNLSERLKSR